jgi:hypothetical protein
MASVNPNGLTWAEWYTAATPGRPCCGHMVPGRCLSHCLRLNPDKAPTYVYGAWRRGVDPLEWAECFGRMDNDA